MNERLNLLYKEFVEIIYNIQIANAIEKNLTIYKLDENNKVIPISAREYFKQLGVY